MRRSCPPLRLSSTWLCPLSIGAACVLRTFDAIAGCDTPNPSSGQTATCSASAPNPSTVPVVAAGGSTQVSVFVLPGAILNVSTDNVIVVRNGSTVRNLGTLNQSADYFDAISSQGANGHNVLINGGAVTTLGIQSEGLFNSAPAAIMTNTVSGVVTTHGVDSAAMLDVGGAGGSALRNDGALMTTGAGSNAMAALTPGNTIVNNGTMTTSGASAAGFYANSSGAGATLTNHGVIDVSGADAHGIVSLDANPGPILNTGSITSHNGLGAFIQHGVTFENTSGASLISLTNNAIDANGGGTFRNAGIISGGNAGLSLVGGDATIVNSGTISGGANPAIDTAGPFAISIVNTGNLSGGNGVAVSTGTGTNTFQMNGGTVTGSIRQGAGIDTFVMQAGQVDTVDQGGAQSRFSMSGGRVNGALTNAGTVGISGGRIGQVQMSAAQNAFVMSGGLVDTTVQSSTGNTVFSMSGGTIGGTVSMNSPNGANAIAITGGVISQGLRTADGPLQFTWLNGGTIAGSVQFGAGDGVATLSNLADSHLAAVTRFDGGAGSDTLVFDNTKASGLSRFVNWETVNVTNSSTLTLDTDGLVLGDAATRTGTLSIDASSKLQWRSAGVSSISAAMNGALVTVRNAGTIDLTGAGGTHAVLRIVGDYVGSGGTLRLQSVLGGDASPGGKLVIVQGSATGATRIGVVNAGGAGALASSDGIVVVQAVQGATTAASAFSLAAPVKAGAFSYSLFRGGAESGTADNWYLRSSLTPVVPVVPVAPVVPVTPVNPAPADPAVPLSPQVPETPQVPQGPQTPPQRPVPASSPMPLYRIEVPLYAGMPTIARQLGIDQLGTFDDRQGNPSLLTGNGGLAASWTRVWADHTNLSSTSGVDAHFSGTISGVQIGQDLYANTFSDGIRYRTGFLLGFSRASGNVSGSALGQQSIDAGRDAIDAATVGVYATIIGLTGWYTDAVMTASTLHITSSSNEGVTAGTHGQTVAASVEAGIPFVVHSMRSLQIEPQVQLIVQHLGIDDFNDGVSKVAFTTPDSLAARLGVRMSAQLAAWQPFARVSVWRTMGGTSQVSFADTTRLPADTAATLAQLDAGVCVAFAQGGAFMTLGYAMNLAGARRSAIGANAGLRWRW